MSQTKFLAQIEISTYINSHLNDNNDFCYFRVK